MNYLIISSETLGLFMIPSLGKRDDVETIYVAVLDKKTKTVGMNMEQLPAWKKMKIVSNPFEVINKYSPKDLIIISDDVGIGHMADYLTKQGYSVIGSSSLTDKLENDRTFGTDLFSRIMKIPPTNTFSSFEEGFKFLKRQNKEDRFVFKPHDGLVPKEYTYVSKDINDMVIALKTFKDEWKWKEEFQLQEFVKGTLADFGAWFNGEEYLTDSHYIYFENKPFLNDDIGPATGGEVAVVFYKKNEGKFFDILEKLKPVLRKSGYVGQISINSMVGEDDKEPYFLEITPRFGYPSFPQDITALEDNDKYLHDLFSALATKSKTSLFPLNKPVVVVVASTPPYPNSEGVEKTKGLPISWDSEYDMYFYPYFVMYDEKKKSIVLTGNEGLALNITCIDETIDGAVSMLYDKYIPSLKLKNVQYRTDAGKDAKDRIKKLKEYNLL